MTARYGVIDVSTLGPMQAIIPTNVEDLLKRRMASFKARWSESDPPMGAAYDVEGLEFDPAKITMEVGTSYQINLESRINQAVRDTTLAFAFGDNLDAIATRYPGGLPRLNKGLANEETDDRYRYRIWLAANAFSTAGAEEAYVFWAMTAVPEFRHVTAIIDRTDRYPVVIVTCLAEGLDPTPTKEQLLTARRVLHLPGIKPLTDIVSVRAPIVIDAVYAADVWLREGPDASVALAEINARVEKLIDDSRLLGEDHTLIAFQRALATGAVHSAPVLSPTVDLPANKRQYIRVPEPPKIVYQGRRS